MTTDGNERPETWRPVPEIDGCTFGGYEASDKGAYRSIDRKVGNRNLKGKVLATSRHEDGYRLVTIRCDSTDPEHRRAHTFAAHKVTLYTFAGPPGFAQEACHSDRGPAFNWWPEGVRWGTKAENHADMVAAGTAVVPEAFPCVNHALCGGMVRNPGRRCRECVQAVGREAAQLLMLGMNAQDVAERFGYKDTRFVISVAQEHGYGGTADDARSQSPTLVQRAKLRRLQFRRSLRSYRG